MLAYLAYADSWVDRSRLAYLFWPDLPEEQARTNLRQRISRLQKALPHVGLEVEPQRARWSGRTDVNEFLAAVEVQEWPRAVALYGGPLLGGAAPDSPALEDWLEAERAGLEAAFRNAAMRYADALQRASSYAPAAGLLARLLTFDPLAEDVLQAYLRVTRSAGQRAEGLAAYEAFRARLLAELRIEPLEETTELAELLRHSDLVVPKPSPPATDPAIWLARPPRLVGRGRALEAVHRATTPLVLLSGEPGIGKTRLAELLTPNAVRLEFREGLQSLPYAAITRHLRAHLHAVSDLGSHRSELARLMPELDPGPPDRPSPRVAKGQLFEALAAYVERMVNTSAGDAFLLFADDLQWADGASLEWLAFLAATDRFRFMGTFRQGEVGAALKGFLSAVETGGLASVVRLEGLTTAEIGALLADLGGEAAVPEAFRTWLARTSGGNPFFALQALKALVESGTLPSSGTRLDLAAAPPHPSLAELPSEVRALVQRRVAHLGAAAQRVLEVASVMREGFTEAVLAPLTGLSQLSIGDLLGRAERAGMISNGRFQHDLFREALYAGIAPGHRRFLHEKVAERIADKAIAGEHWWLAGHGERAVAGWLEGAKALSDRGLMEEAVTVLERALAHAPDQGRVRAWLAHAHLHAGHLDAAREAAEQLATDGHDPTERLWGLLVLADCDLRRGRLREAVRNAELGIELLPAVTEAELPPAVHAVFASILATEGSNERAHALMAPRLAVAADPHEHAYNLLIKGYILDRGDATEEAWAYYGETLAEARRLEAKHLEVHAAAFATFTAIVLGRAREGEELAELALARGSFQYTPLLKTHLAYLYLTTGRNAAALRLTEEVIGSDDAQLVGLAWAHRVEALAALGRSTLEAVDAALGQLERTDFPNTRAAIVTAAIAHGTPAQRQRALRHAERVPRELLHRFYLLRLERALGGGSR